MTIQPQAHIEALLELFFEADDKWVEISEHCSSRGQGLCDAASEDLVAFLHNQGVQASILWLDTRNYHALKPYEHYGLSVGDHNHNHCVALVEQRLVVDLTARQFDANLAFPMFWEVPQ